MPIPGPVEIGTVTLSHTKKVLSATFFVGSIILFIIVTKAIEIHYVYPPYKIFGFSQMVPIVIMLWIGRYFNLVQFPHLDRRVVGRMFPLLLLYCGSIASNIEYFGIKEINIFNMSHRLVLLVIATSVLEHIILKVEITTLVKLTLAAMVFGAIIGGTEEVAIVNYIIILINYSFSAAIRVYFKKILDSREIGVIGLMYYSSIILFTPPMIVACVVDTWNDTDLLIRSGNLTFWYHLLLTSIMGAMISCSIVLCIQYNGALTTTMMGNLLNCLIIAVLFFQNYSDDENLHVDFSWLYILGWCIIVLASLMYLFFSFKPSFSNKALASKDVVDI